MMRRSVIFPVLCALALAVAAQAEGGAWRKGTPLERPRASLAAAAVGANVYVGGGAGLLAPESDFDVYESGLGQWRELSPLPEGRARFGMASVDGKIYIAGGSIHGQNAVASASTYDTRTDAWSPLPDMPDAREGLVLLAVNGRLYAVGGTSAAVDVYDVTRKSWSRTSGSADLARMGAAAAVVKGQIYLIGGRVGDHATQRVDVFDTAAGAWRRGPDLPAPRTGLAAAVVGGRLHVLGGAGANGLDAAVDHWVLSADGASWAHAPDLPAPRADFAAVAAGDKLVIVGGGSGGGFYGPFTAAPAVDLFVPAE
jgi:N-acetylneuraminic acid mutarotase